MQPCWRKEPSQRLPAESAYTQLQTFLGEDIETEYYQNDQNEDMEGEYYQNHGNPYIHSNDNARENENVQRNGSPSGPDPDLYFNSPERPYDVASNNHGYSPDDIATSNYVNQQGLHNHVQNM